MQVYHSFVDGLRLKKKGLGLLRVLRKQVACMTEYRVLLSI
jgi:hypothetical protein